jgi:hypothetical protein
VKTENASPEVGGQYPVTELGCQDAGNCGIGFEPPKVVPEGVLYQGCGRGWLTSLAITVLTPVIECNDFCNSESS